MAGLGLALFAFASQAAEPVLSIFPEAKEYKGGFASYGGTKLEVRKDDGIVFLENAKSAGFVYWFYNHKPLAKSTASLWQNSSVQLQVRSLHAPLNLAVTAAWRGRAEPAQVGPASRVQTTIETEWTSVSIPLPDFSTLDGDKLTGLVIQFSKGGAFEIRSIQIDGSTDSAQLQPAATPVPSAANPPPRQEADVAARKLLKSGEPDPAFQAAHERNLARAKKGGVGCLFLGDSITQGWLGNRDLWEKSFGAYQPANFGVGGDGTQHLLWRIQNGELDGIDPKVVVLMIGTNNTNWHDAKATTRGVQRILETIHEKLPSTRILLLGALPRGEKPNAYRAKNEQLNASLRETEDGKKLVFLDMGARFVEPDGTINKEIMPDYLHLSRAGYEIWAESMGPKLAEMMQ